MKILKFAPKHLMLLLLTLTVFSCSDDDDSSNSTDDDTDTEDTTITISEYLESDSDYTSLVAALEQADLLDTLSDDTANFTLFAPDNDAFETLLTNLGVTLDEISDEDLSDILLYHVIGSELISTDVAAAVPAYIKTLATSNDNFMDMYIDSDLNINGGVSTVETADAYDASNGIIHAVSEVITLPTIVTFAAADTNFTSLVSALTYDDSFTFVDELSSDDADNDSSPYTVFAPTNDAFTSLFDELGITSLDEVDTDLLSSTLYTHVVADANVISTDLTDGMTITTASTYTLTVGLDPVTLTDENERVANVTTADIQASNGVIHVIDNVVLPALN